MRLPERVTVQARQTGKAWQRIIREEAAERYAGLEWWERADLSLKRAVIRPTSRAIAAKIILEYEWLGTLPLGCKRFYGLFFGGWACGGVLAICSGKGGGANRNAYREFGIAPEELSYLARGACTHWTPPGSASKLIAWSLRMEAERGAKVAIAYSDTDAGEIGTVYQATNWLCLGKGQATEQFIHPVTGRIYDKSLVHRLQAQNGLLGVVSWSEMRKWLYSQGWKGQLSNPKYRYAYILAHGAEREAIYNRIKHKIIPYPKRGI